MNSSLGILLSDQPIQLYPNLKLYQPTIRDIVNMGEEYYALLLKIWTLKREELIPQENEYTKQLNDYEVWLEYILSVPRMKSAVVNSCLVFFRKKVEFFPLTHTMYIGEKDTGILLDLGLYREIQHLFSKLDYSKKDEETEQYKKTEHMSAREKRIYAHLKAGQEKLDKIKSSEQNIEDTLGKQIVALVAIGHYTYKEVYDMTMLQFLYLLNKYVEIENYELRTVLSPYVSSKDNNQDNKHWLN